MCIFEILPDEMIIEVLDKLSLVDMIAILYINREFYTRLYPYLNDKITAIKYGPYMKIIEREQSGIVELMNFPRNLVLLNSNLTRVMNLEHLPKKDGLTVYTSHLLYLWWMIYIGSYDLRDGSIVNPDSTIDEVFGQYYALIHYPEYPLRDYKIQRLMYHQIVVDHEIELTAEIASSLYHEKLELDHICSNLERIKKFYI